MTLDWIQHAASRNPCLVVSALVAAILILSTAIMHTLARLAGRSGALLALLFMPGVAVHELAHALACVLTGTRVRRIVLWNGRGGLVEHDRPRWAVLQPLISFFPVPVGLLVLALAARQFIDGDWLRNGALMWLMVSVGATLAPSGEDWRSALLGTVLLLGALVLTGQIYPAGWQRLEVPARGLVPHLVPVVGLQAGMFVALLLLRRVTRGRG